MRASASIPLTNLPINLNFHGHQIDHVSIHASAASGNRSAGLAERGKWKKPRHSSYYIRPEWLRARGGKGRGGPEEGAGACAHGTSFPIAIMRHLAASQGRMEERKEGRRGTLSR